MQTKHIIIIIISIILCNTTIAQDDVYYTPERKKKEKTREKKDKDENPANSGFVFIDGEYILPPYKVEQKKPGKIYINDKLVANLIRKTDTVLNPYKVDQKPKLPDTISKFTSLKELEEVKYKNKNYLNSLSGYYYTHFKKKIANEKFFKELFKIPCVKSIENGELILYNGDKQAMLFSPYWWCSNFYEKYGVNSKRKLPTKREIRKRTKKEVDRIISRLNDNQFFYYYNHEKFYKNGTNKGKIFKIQISEYSLAKKNYLKNTFKKAYKPLPLNIPPAVKKRIKLIRKKYIDKGIIKPDSSKNINKKTGSLSPLNNNKNKGNTAYSPKKANYNSLCTSHWDNIRFITENNEVVTIKNNGIALAEINTKLLEKIEELTLYIIELNENIKRIESEKII